jgi:hypothetical protein
MVLKELVSSVDAAGVAAAAMTAYPEYPGREAFEEGYLMVVERLRGMEPVVVKPMTIVVSQVTDELDIAGEPVSETYIDVSGRDGEGGMWGLCMTPWAEWLGMDVEIKGIDLTPEQLVAHILYEMTFYGFEEEQVQGFAEELREQAAEVDELLASIPEGATDEERNAALEAGGLVVHWPIVEGDE